MRRVCTLAIYLRSIPELPLVIAANRDEYLERLPTDPWGSAYQYLAPGVKGEIDVFSLGADKARGGEGNAADIGNWE